MQTDKDKLKKLESQIKSLRCDKQALQRKLWDVNESRNKWRARYKAVCALSKSGCMDDLFSAASEKARGYSYTLPLVLLCVRLQRQGSMSLRGVVHILLCLHLSLGVMCKRVPCASTIRAWVSKVGKWRVGNSGTPSGSEWVYWIDESIHIGGEKILLILGCLIADLPTIRALTLQDLTVLHLSVSASWTGVQIADVLQGLQKQYKLGYVVSDCGGSLVSAYQITQIVHIPDCTHVLSNAIEKLYKPQEQFTTFSQWANALRSKWVLNASKKAYLPPKQRTKVRFANLFPLVEWAHKQLTNWQTLPADVQQAFAFLYQQSVWIKQFYTDLTHIKQVSAILKNKGYTYKTQQEITQLHTNKNANQKVSGTLIITITDYLNTIQKMEPQRCHWVCCSDIIESAFGKLKQKLPRSSTTHLTEFIFTLANATGTLNQKDVKEALENIRDKDLKNNLRSDVKASKKADFCSEI